MRFEQLTRPVFKMILTQRGRMPASRVVVSRRRIHAASAFGSNSEAQQTLIQLRVILRQFARELSGIGRSIIPGTRRMSDDVGVNQGSSTSESESAAQPPRSFVAQESALMFVTDF